MDNLKTESEAANGCEASAVERIVMFFRRHVQCRFGTHWKMKYDSGLSNDIGRAGTCLDCGYRAKDTEWGVKQIGKHLEETTKALEEFKKEAEAYGIATKPYKT